MTEYTRETIDIHGKQYETVGSRVLRFRQDKPQWFIHTVTHEVNEDYVRIGASIGYHMEDGTALVLATGYAEEYRDDGKINKTSALENCETSAIGRALAFLGYGGTNSIASAEEVLTAKRKEQSAAEATQEIPGYVALLDAAADNGIVALEKVWETLTKPQRKLAKPFMVGPKGISAKALESDKKAEEASAWKEPKNV